jgi:hypothetical protein
VKKCSKKLLLDLQDHGMLPPNRGSFERDAGLA